MTNARPRSRALLAALLAVATLSVLVPAAPAAASPVLEGSATRLYQAYFLRAPDAGGLQYWVGKLQGDMSLVAVSGQFAASPEFRARYGRLDDGAFVDLVYRNVLGRAPDAEGRAYWTDQMRQGRTRGWVMVGFSESAEFVRKTGTVPPQRPLAVGQAALRQTPNSPNVFDNADPAVLVVGSRTYLYGSTNNMKLPVSELPTLAGSLSDSQRSWARSPHDAMPTRPAWVDPADSEIWAPSVAIIGGRYHVYFAASRPGAVDQPNDQCIGRAVATAPTGPFVSDAEPMYCGLPPERGSNPWGRGALDPEVVQAPSGERFLLVALSRATGNIGALRLDGNGVVIGGRNAQPAILAHQSVEWHDGTPDGVARGGAFLENPSMIYDPTTNTYLLFYSAGRWYTSEYVTGFARCSTPMGPCVVDTRGPMLVNGNGRTGAGGLTAFRDSSGHPTVAYASWTSGRENQVGGVGEYKRQTHFQALTLGSSTDPAQQTVRIG
ncbi:MAG: DUF4214 domain-containing protein [Acidimicrobiia bacterium]|nr:DUF4214 domain-containing protein [Acidimicrobiia bacterium]